MLISLSLYAELGKKYYESYEILRNKLNQQDSNYLIFNI